MREQDQSAAAEATGRVSDSIAAVAASDWDACAGADNPFVSHAFLSALEASGSVDARTGWLPQHVLIEAAGRLLAAAPLYLKNHSYGEYVFDHGWAAALERAGGRYYPKLQCAVPFTPATGPRLLVHPEAPDGTREMLIDAMVQVARQHKVSSLHVTFPTEAEFTALGAAGFLQRTGKQFHWENHGYRSFDDFLEALNSRKRKSIRKERREAVAQGLVIETLTGATLRPEHWDAFYAFYVSTSDRKWGSAYLNRTFFDLLHRTMADKVVLVMVRDGARYVAGALNLRGSDTLFGRNWGCLGDYKFLHFEACYYRAIDFAIEHGLTRVEAGAQGTHKIQRGYLPNTTYSAHWIRDPGFARAVADFLEHERAAIDEEIDELSEFSPFKREAE